jgi:hypothetical protein
MILAMLLVGGVLGYLIGLERQRTRVRAAEEKFRDVEEANAAAAKLVALCMESAVKGGVFKNWGDDWETCETCGYDYSQGFGYCEPCARVRRAREEGLRDAR